MAVSSSKCDDIGLVESVSSTISSPRIGTATLSSAKCDWHVVSRTSVHAGSVDLKEGSFSGRFGFGRVSVASSKSDWNIRSPGALLHGREASTVAGLEANLPGGGLSVSSSKCDWHVRSDAFVVATQSGERVSELHGKLAVGEVRLSSSKCDWTIKAVGDPRAQRLPSVNTSLSSSKCDFSLMLDFGLQGGPRYRVRAVGSSKCDFHIVDFDQLSNIKEPWRPISLSGSKLDKKK